MVKLFAVQKFLLHSLAKMAGLSQQTVEVEPGTTISFWAPEDKKSHKPSTKDIVPSEPPAKKVDFPEKPAVVLVHGFVADGITTWVFQVMALAKHYAVYVPDLLFFGGSATASGDRSPAFQAKCMVGALEKLGVERCTVVGFSYGGVVAFKMAEARPDVVKSLVVTGSSVAMTESITKEMLGRLGFASCAQLLLPESVEGFKALLSVGTHLKLWFPHQLLRDFLNVMFNNRKERAELLDELVIRDIDAKVPDLPQKILLLWGENDVIFKFQIANNMKEQLGANATLHGIKKAGHLVQLEKPFIYNHHLKKFLAIANAKGTE